MDKNTFIRKKIDLSTSFLYDRKEVVTAPMWPNNSSELRNIYTSSNQPHHQKIYYRTIFSDSAKTGSLDVDFSIAYGHYAGSGSSTGSYGLLEYNGAVSESLAIYSQYRSMLYEQDKRKYLSDGKFRFYGLTDVYLGAYAFGSNNIDNVLNYLDRVKIPGVKSFNLNKIKSISSYKYDEYANANIKFYLINEEGKLFYNQNGQFDQIIQIGTDEDWEMVSFGSSHNLAIKQDGTLWGWGSNSFGQLGIGFSGNSYSEPTKIGIQKNWKQVYAGRDFSFAINSNGELYAWGRNIDTDSIGGGILGFGDSLDRYYPQKVGSNTWKKISLNTINSTIHGVSKYCIHAIDTDGKLWGWGNNSLVNYSIEPTQLGTDTNWKDIAAGYDFAIGIQGDNNELYGWGSTGLSGELLAALTPIPSITYPSSVPFSSKKNLTSGNIYGIPESGWTSVDCGPDFTFAINSNGNMYCWGNNSDNQLNVSANPLEISIQQSSQLSGWDIISCGSFNSTAVINTPNRNVNSMVSDDIYVINFNRWNFRDKIDSGTWQLSLRTVYTGSGQQLLYEPAPSTSPPYSTITLIDESVNLQGTEAENPMYDVTSKGGIVYGIYRGSIENGIDESAVDSPYGLFFPENGIIILNGEILVNPGSRQSITIQTRRTPATSSGAYPFSSNADLMYASIKGAMELDEKYFIANTVETKIPTYCFIRINNDEFNYTMNRTKYQKNDSFLLKDKFRTVPYPFTYITSIGLYNDNDDLLAVAKLSKPIFKNPSTELVVKIKLDI